MSLGLLSHVRITIYGLTSTRLAHCTTADTSISAIGKRAHPMHVMAFYATICVPLASIGWVMRGGSFLWSGFLSVTDLSNRMIITRTKFVIPTRPEWLVLLVMIGIFSFLGQVTELVQLQLFRNTERERYFRFYLPKVFNAKQPAGVLWPCILESSPRFCSSWYFFTLSRLTFRWLGR